MICIQCGAVSLDEKCQQCKENYEKVRDALKLKGWYNNE